MNEDIGMILDMAKDSMSKALAHLDQALLKIRAGKANPVMLDSVRVNYYGSKTPLNQIAGVTAPDGRTLMIQPFDKSAITEIEKAIAEANLGFNPQNDGSIIRIAVPSLNEERRMQLVKQAREEGENAKISIRNSRKDANAELKQLKSDGVSEDLVKGGEEEIQKITNTFSASVDDKIKIKEGEILTV